MLAKHSYKNSLRVPVTTLWPLLDAFEGIGGDVDGLLCRYGVDVDKGCERRRPTISRERFASIAGEILFELHVHTTLRKGLPHFPTRTFRMMCRAMLSTSTLREAMEVAIEFSQIIGGGGVSGLEVSADKAFFFVSPAGDDRSEAAFLVAVFGVAVMHRLFSWLIGEEISLSRVDFAFPYRAASELLMSLYHRFPRFDSNRTGFGFEARMLEKSVVRSGHDIDELFQLFPFDLFPPEYQSKSVADRVKTIMRRAMVSGSRPPKLRQLAADCGFSASTIRRRLADEGQSLNALQRALREEIATSLLVDSCYRISDVAERLGYGDSATFRRAFHSWTGMSPARWRRMRQMHPVIKTV